MLRSLRSFITLFLLLITISGFSQSVGLVLSGGGAKGLYHIGVIEALEQNGIPIDYVAGTSMGSIVAGLYAAGYSTAQMREIVTSGEIEQWLTGKIDSSYGAYYRDYRTMPTLFSLRIGIESSQQSLTEESSSTNSATKSSLPKTSLYLPGSVIAPIQVDMTLNRLFAAASESVGRNFDRLMVPFLCVASDMRNHQAVVLTSGDLGEAIRASMAIPIAFTPVVRDTMVLFDGGIYDNYPWQPLLERHAPEIMIGSICTSGNTILDEQSGLIDQVFAITTNKSDYNMPDGNLTIQRDVDAGMLDFANSEWIIDQGYEDAMEQMETIKERITERRDSTYYDQRRAQFLENVHPLIFEEYEVNGLTTEQNLYVRDFLHTSEHRQKALQREMPFEELQENLYQILSSGDFTTQYPKIKFNESTQRYKYFINLETKPQLKLSVGGYLSSTAFNQLDLSLNYQSVKRVAQSYYADLYLGTLTTSAMIGGRTDFFINKPLFLDYYYAYSNINRTYSNLGNLSQVTNCESAQTRDNYFSIGGGIPFSRRSLLSLRFNGGYSYYYYDEPDALSTVEIDPAALYDRTRLLFGAMKLEYQRSTLDRLVYPTTGSKLSVSAIAIDGSERTYQSDYGILSSTEPERHRWWGARLKYSKYIQPPGDSWFSLGIDVDAVYTSLQQFGNPTASMLMMPSYQPVAQSKMIFMPDYSANKYIGVGAIPIFNLADNLLLRTGFYAMYRDIYSIEGVESGIIASERLHYIGELTTVYHSSVGAVSLSLTKYDLGDWNNFYLTFGFGIPIFAPKGTYY